MTLQEAIRARHSVRAYQDKTIPLATESLLKGRIERLNKQYDLNTEVGNGNAAAGIMVFGMFVGLGLVISGVIA